MRSAHRVAGFAAIAVSAGFVIAPAAHAATGTTLYVNRTATCSNTDPSAGSQALPFCSVQAAADAAQPGQTVVIGGPIGETYWENLVVKHSGAPGAPITFTGAGYYLTAPGASPALTLSGVHDVAFSGLTIEPYVHGGHDAIDIIGSQNVSLDRLALSYLHANPQGLRGIDVDGSSSAITLSRSTVSGLWDGGAVRVESGAHDVVVTTNHLSGWGVTHPLVQVSGASGVDLTSNSLSVTSNSISAPQGVSDIAIDAGSTADVENNVGYGSKSPALSVSTDSAAHVVSDYNAFQVATVGAPKYLWAGVDYATVAAFTIATAQGAHDIDGPASGNYPQIGDRSPLVDSANSDAPGELSTDAYGHPRVHDPHVTATGVGHANYYDRGAVEVEDSIAYPPSSSAATVAVSSAFDGQPVPAPTSAWGEALTATVDFGDGSTQQSGPVGTSIYHSYQQVGVYLKKTTITNGDGGYSVSGYQDVNVLPAAPLAPVLVAGLNDGPYTPDTLRFTMTGIDGQWEIAHWTANFGDGSTVADLTNGITHTYPRPGIYTVTFTGTDLLGRPFASKSTAVVGTAYNPLDGGPQRAYDSRTKGRDTVPAHAVVRLSTSALHVATVAPDAVQLNVTVTNPEAGGFVTVYPDGAARPNVSNVNFTPGLTVANQVTASVGSSGYVDFYNGSDKPIDLVVDTVGSHTSAQSGSVYHAVGPVRVLDTRAAGGRPVAGNGTITVPVSGLNGVPTNAMAAAFNVTAVNALSSGFLTAYGSGQNRPGVSNANWTAGKVVPALVTVSLTSGGVPLANGGLVLHNGGGGSVDFVADLVGYYDMSSTGSVFLPSAPTRVLDTRGGIGASVGQLGAQQTLRLKVAGVGGVPAAGVAAAALNLTVTDSAGAGFLSAYPDGTVRGGASSVNFTAGQTVANMTVTPVGADGYVDIYNGGSAPVSVIADLSGTYYSYGATG
ncbi:hypothetical protein ABIA33_006257 [Streptacidiphilus sp. MAP12-16]